MNRFLIGCLLIAGLYSCDNNRSEQHAHNADGSHPGEEALQPLSYTLYTGKSELFVEFKPLVVGTTSKFAAHLTRLGENFLPTSEGTVTVSLIVKSKGIKNTADAPASPGIFRLGLQPTEPGTGRLVFDIVTKEYVDQIIIDSVEIYADEKTALSKQAAEPSGADITFLKEQAWKLEFANTPVVQETIFDVIKTTGELIPAPGDAVSVAAKSNGIVKFSNKTTVAGTQVRAGQNLFTVTGGEIPFENVDAAKQAARTELTAARSEFERTSELIKDKLITQAEFQQSKLRYDQAQIALSNLNRNYSASGRSVSSPINGFIQNIAVSEGEYVNAGQVLANITRGQRLTLRADVSLKDAERITDVHDANFKLVQSSSTYNISALNGKLISVGKTTTENSPFLPVHFQIDSKPGMLPGSFAEVYLKTRPIHGVLTIPVSALIEEQGIFYAYVQTEGESFQKRELKLGANDGQKVQVLSGVSEGERVVTKGAYNIKLSQASGELPAHGHEH